ncbi:hypothetical protein VT84_27905 [Gemmata sp. SH-PL17]|uniref:Uncharacterized protein n=1 Tax=Gemmata massiliana TaxID=1210884 RepID=A0A6P2D8V4_9BACT|nr:MULTISPECIES: hypothetical protein [Gemmata]AMV28260.1 hypothetical protein VT84_27905 [Gemmata sp. SH-PL17]VTR97287.1 unnamed protein product [Gemmata massiliana]
MSAEVLTTSVGLPVAADLGTKIAMTAQVQAANTAIAGVAGTVVGAGHAAVAGTVATAVALAPIAVPVAIVAGTFWLLDEIFG